MRTFFRKLPSVATLAATGVLALGGNAAQAQDKTITLCCEILARGRHTGISDEHPTTVAFKPPSPGIFAGQAYANPQARRHLFWATDTSPRRCPDERPPIGQGRWGRVMM